MPIAAVFGCAGPELSAAERAFFAESAPWGFILFKRNVVDPDQVRRLVDACRAAVGWRAPVLIDQEGGRVARLGPPHWAERPAAGRIGALWRASPERAEEAARLDARLIAADLHALGLDVDCAPVLDVPARDGHAIIGDRAFGADPEAIAALGRAFCVGLLDGGVLPVVKHVPGHGRARADSHHALPTVEADADTLAAVDFAPFRALADMPLAMTAHVAYAALDGGRPATLSRPIIGRVIRREIGFGGVLLSDDLSMKALSGSLGQRAAECLEAGCDIALHCNGDMAEMADIAARAPALAGDSARRCAAALDRRRMPGSFDAAAAESRLGELLAAAV
jgi:beta-N-acetylhexosaminidase